MASTSGARADASPLQSLEAEMAGYKKERATVLARITELKMQKQLTGDDRQELQHLQQGNQSLLDLINKLQEKENMLLRSTAATAAPLPGGIEPVELRVERVIHMEDADSGQRYGDIAVVNGQIQISTVKEVLAAKNLCLSLVDGVAPTTDKDGWSLQRVPQDADSIKLTTAPRPGTKMFHAYGIAQHPWGMLPAWTARILSSNAS